MIAPLRIEFHNTHPVKAVESRIRQELAELEKFYTRLLSCRVDVEAPEHEHRSSVSKIRVEFGLPPEDAARAEQSGVATEPGTGHMEVKAEHTDASMAVHAAFTSARHRLRDFVMIPKQP